MEAMCTGDEETNQQNIQLMADRIYESIQVKFPADAEAGTGRESISKMQRKGQLFRTSSHNMERQEKPICTMKLGGRQISDNSFSRQSMGV